MGRSSSRSGERKRSPTRSRSPAKRSRSRSDRKPENEDWGVEGHVVDIQSRGFGFIRPEGGQVRGSDLYFHCSGVSDNMFDRLRKGDRVGYRVIQDDRSGRYMARSVRILDGDGGRSRSPRRRSRSNRGRRSSRERRSRRDSRGRRGRSDSRRRR
mmetsp:Transcript_15158/g.33479  ORF Transcript_15158/g.33479 Transcript_15158/m.33479 type:complete len:155 (-) Transcript_15158:124-588(-)